MKNHNKAVCTVIAKNYLANARTMCQSFLSLHPDHRCFVLIADEFEGYINPQDECFEIVPIGDLGIANLPGFCFKYDVTELCTALKPFFLEYLLRKHSIDKLLYIDPDIYVTNPLDSLYEKLDRFDVVLTPHIETDYPEDGYYPNDSAVYQTGIFNLGFIGVRNSKNTGSFLEWWKGKLSNKCVRDFSRGYFVDQKFIDLGPVLFDNVHIEKGVGYNVAYWNLHSRSIRKQNGTWNCNEGPLYFYHFSGYQQADLDSLTHHIPKDEIRYRTSDDPEVKKIFSEYRELVNQNGYAETSKWPYGFSNFRNGNRIPYGYRRLYRDHLSELESFGDPFDSPALVRRLMSKSIVNRDTVVAKMIVAFYRRTPRLRSIFRKLTGPRLG